jgi:uncharacterized cupredoxin-like copper-binding protein
MTSDGAGRIRARRVLSVAALAGALLAGGVAWMLDPSGAVPGGSRRLCQGDTPCPPGDSPTVKITARYSRFEPDRVTVKPGSTVRFVIHNADPIDHEFIIGPAETHDIHERGAPHFHTGAVQGEVTVPAGSTVETTWTFTPSGGDAVEYGCHLAGHWTYGMHGKALVR